MPVPILVTGAVGFIGFHVVERLLALSNHVVSVDSFVSWYRAYYQRAGTPLLVTQ